nr:MAG TPA_asm: hypothetical protein [Caudoviricetes sp.]
MRGRGLWRPQKHQEERVLLREGSAAGVLSDTFL